MGFWAVIKAIVEAIIEILEYANKVYEYIGYLRAVNTLNERGGPEALLQGVVRSYLVGAVVDTIAENISEPSDGDGKLDSDVEEETNHVAETVKNFIGGDLFGTLLGAFRIVGSSDFLSETSKATKQVTDGERISNGQNPTQNQSDTGDPILLATGEFERQVTDLKIAGAGMDFEFRRVYRSGAAYNGPLGMNWDHNYNFILRQENEFVVVQLTGDLSEHRFVQHPRFGAAEYSYYTPPNGVHDVIEPDGGGSFILRKPGGTLYRFRQTTQPEIHRIHKIEDRFGNFLEFQYDPGDEKYMRRILVNSQARYVQFTYDQLGRIKRLEDHANRVVLYRYDEWGYLECVLGPAFSGDKPERTESYEYEFVGNSRKLVRVYDFKGRIIVENEYQQDTLSRYAGYLIRQCQNRGETTLVYELITEEADPNLPPRDKPSLRVWEYRRNGHEIEHVLNNYGNDLLTRQRYVEGGRFREVVKRYSYNADGQMIARLEPNGILTQYLYERDHIADHIQWPDVGHVLTDVSMKARMSFGNMLAEVVRGKKVAQSTAWVAHFFWEQRIPSVKVVTYPDDYVIKYTYDRDNQLVASKSDPRHTISADPLHVESSKPGDASYNPLDSCYINHQRHLTRFEYGLGPRFELKRTIYPDRTRPSALDGITKISGIVEIINMYDAKGRPLEQTDKQGYKWFDEYYDDTSGPKEGFLRKQLIPHIDWFINNNTPNILEIQKNGNWQQSVNNVLSSGTVGDWIKIIVEGVRITLYQSTNMTDIIASNSQVEVRVDSNLISPWDQTQESKYVIDNLSRGRYEVEIRDTTGNPISLGRICSHVSMEYEVDDLGRVFRETDRQGHITVHSFNALGRKTKTTKGPPANPSVTHYENDPSGRLIMERKEWRDENGHIRPEVSVIKQMQYDKAGLLLSETEGPEQKGIQRTTRYRYDVEDNLRVSINPRGVHDYIEYDELNRRVRTVRAGCSPDCQIARTTYDLAGQVLMNVNPRGARYFNGYTLHGGELRTGIDTMGRVRIQTDPLGHMVVHDYDKLDNPITVWNFQLRPDGRFELLSRRETGFDEHGDTIRVRDAIFNTPILTADPVSAPDVEFQSTSGSGLVREAVTEFHLDAYGHIVALRKPDNSIEREWFDGQSRSIEQVDALGVRTRKILDGNGNVARTYLIEPARDPATNAHLRDEVFVQIHQYDKLNMETLRTDSYGNSWQWVYDSLGLIKARIDPLRNIVHYEYNAFGEQLSVIQERTQTGLGGGVPLPPLITKRTYDAAGNVIEREDPLGRKVEFEYDVLDRQVLTRFLADPADPTEQRIYDKADNLIRIEQRSGLVLTLQYDLLNRHVSTDIDETAVGATDRLSPDSPRFRRFTYDASRNVVRHENDFCRVNISRDSVGKPISEDITILGLAGAPPTQTLNRQFNYAGRVERLIFPSGRIVDFERDPLGRVQAVLNVSAQGGYSGRSGNGTGFEIARFQYVGHRLTDATYGNGVRLHIRYDGRGHIVERLLVTVDSSERWRMQQLRDSAGHTRLENASHSAGGRSRKLFFDSTYQISDYADSSVSWFDLTLVAPPNTSIDPNTTTGQGLLDAAIGSMALPPLPHAFHYDDAGSRARTAEPGRVPFNSTTTPLNQYANVDGIPWNYDTVGNLRSDGSLNFTYDISRALQAIHDAGSSMEIVSYFRDALGRIVAERTPSGMKFYVNDSNRALVEIDGSECVEFTHGDNEDRILHIARRGEDYWVSYDGVGSVRGVLDGDGNVVTMPLYRPYGMPENGALPVGLLPVGFGAMRSTNGLNVYHSVSRSYRPDLGIHLQRDPAGFIDGPNLYLYANNNPIDASDPSGKLALVDDAIFWGIGRLFGVRSDSFLSGVAHNFVESWSLVLGTFNTFHGAKNFGDVMWSVLKLVHKLTLGLPQELAGIIAGYGAIEFAAAETELWQNVQLIKIPGTSFGAFTLGSKVIGDPSSLGSGSSGIRAHEQGHFYQNLVLGPLYIPVIGIPSLIHAGLHPILCTGHPYGHFYTEAWADAWK